MKNRSFLPLFALALLVFGAQAASAKVITVDDNGADCRKPDFNTIQAAVNAAAPGDTIKVCAGTYTEQVMIPASKNGLALRSHTPLAAVIKAPAVMINEKAIVLVRGAQNVSIDAFTITGPGGGGCDSIRYGVRIDGGGSAELSHNHITEIHDTPFSGCQNGNAIQVGRRSEGQTGTATITKNKIDRYQKSGIVVDNTGSSAEILDNEITGVGPTAIIAQNGIQISRGATANVQHNEVSQNQYAPMTVASAGILAFETNGGVNIEHNILSHNDESVYSDTNSGLVVRHNKISNNTFDGIGLIATTGATVSHNFSDGNGFDGIYVASNSSDNFITNNQMDDNAEHDAHDDSVGPRTAGTANTWEKNHCGSANPENKTGLCDQTN
jgi:nitrous oxidase accessory protein NosD